MTLKRFIIFVFLTLDIGLFVQPYPLGPLFLIHALFIACSCEQTDKTQWERWHGGDVRVCTSKRGMMRVTLHGPVMLSDVTHNRRYALFVCGTTVLCCECCLMMEQLNLSRCYLSRRNFSHRTFSDSVCRCEAVVGVRKQKLSNKSLTQLFQAFFNEQSL